MTSVLKYTTRIGLIFVLLVVVFLLLPKPGNPEDNAKMIVNAFKTITIPTTDGNEVWIPTSDGSYVRENGGAFLEVTPSTTPDQDCWLDVTLQRTARYEWGFPCDLLKPENTRLFAKIVLEKAFGKKVTEEMILKYAEDIRPTQELLRRLLEVLGIQF